MPLANYGVWAATPTRFTAETNEDDPKSPHIHLYFSDGGSSEYKAAINVKSSAKGESRLAYWMDPNFTHPMIAYLGKLDRGFHALGHGDRNGLDYIRGNILDRLTGTLLPHDIPEDHNDMLDYMRPLLQSAIDKKTTIFLFGEQFSDKKGIHDVHQNQGNSKPYDKDNGVWQDGGIIIQFGDHWEAVFLAFGIQKAHTDDRTGAPIGEIDWVTVLENKSRPPVPTIPDGAVLIRAALVNPVGPDGSPVGEPETVHLSNRTRDEIDLEGWSIVNKNRNSQKLSGKLAPGGDRKFLVPKCPLSNRGGTISLLDKNGIKVDGVSYTAAEAQDEGVFLFFN